jgi:mannitol 2-dehydrogenase
MTTKLALASLPSIAPTVKVPNYQRSSLSPGIVHFGVGNFHRAHLAVYQNDLCNQGRDLNWAIVGAGTLEADRPLRQKLAEQDYLTTVVEQAAESVRAEVIGTMIDYIEPRNSEAITAWLSKEVIRVVSLTITEGGYFIDPATGVFNPSHPDLAHDATPSAVPRTVFGLIIAGLKARRAAGLAPFTVLSCDNIPGNGHVTQNAVVGLAERQDRELAEWIRTTVAFPNSMVDRITPATGERERAIVRDMFGIEDNSPVFCEDFKQWVLEDHFCAGRPGWEHVGAQFVPDVAPYELMKIRILNGGHAAIAYPSALLDFYFVHEAMRSPLIRNFLAKLEHEEIIPVVPEVPGTDLHSYFQLVERRFSNPRIGDTIPRLCLDGSNRQPKFILPSIADRLRRGEKINGLALVSALWCRYCGGPTESGKAIAPNDTSWDRLTAKAAAARDNPLAFLEMTDIYGEVGRSPVFKECFTTSLNSLWTAGVAATLQGYLDGTS